MKLKPRTPLDTEETVIDEDIIVNPRPSYDDKDFYHDDHDFYHVTTTRSKLRKRTAPLMMKHLQLTFPWNLLNLFNLKRKRHLSKENTYVKSMANII